MPKVPQVNKEHIKSAYIKHAWEPDPVFILLLCVLANIPSGILTLLSRLRDDSKLKTAALSRRPGAEIALLGRFLVIGSFALDFVTRHIWPDAGRSPRSNGNFPSRRRNAAARERWLYRRQAICAAPPLSSVGSTFVKQL